jgi:hypothetical protein
MPSPSASAPQNSGSLSPASIAPGTARITALSTTRTRARRRRLCGGVQPRSEFAESARAGWVNINEGTNYWESHLPFGGRAGSQSGLGRVGGRFSIERLTELKTIVVNLA